MESEVRECRGYGTDWIIGTGERETIDQGLDGMEGKYWNEIIRTNNGIYEFDGGIDIHGADLSDEIDGTYENDRI